MAGKKPIDLNYRQKQFCVEYINKNYNATQAALAAGYSEKTADVQGGRLLKDVRIVKEIQRLQKSVDKKNEKKIASAQEVMEYFTKVMNGEIMDQFGLEAPLAERTKAAQELAKRTVDIENRARGTADAKIEIKLDWGMED